METRSLGGSAIPDTLATDAEVTAAIAADVHGASRHTDFSRTISLRPEGGLSYGPGTALEHHQYGSVYLYVHRYAVSNDRGSGAVFFMPADAKASSPLLLDKIIWSSTSGDASAHVVNWRTGAKKMPAGHVVTDTPTETTYTGVSAVRVIDEIIVDTGSTLLTSVSAGDLIAFEILRNATDLADTHASSVDLIAVQLSYTATQ